MKRKLLLPLVLFFMASALVSCSPAGSGKDVSSAEEEQATSADQAASGEQNDSEGQAVSFETTDLDGNSVRSEDLFGESRLTMVNIWGTFCGPCIGEMPELELLSSRLGTRDCRVVGIVCDVAGPRDTDQIESAQTIVQETGVTYQNLLPWNGFNRVLPAQYIPTTYFIDQNGRIVGDPVVGAMGADDYEALVDDVLSRIEP